MSSAAPKTKKKSFDRGGPVWPPRSNVTNDRLRGGVRGGFAPPAKNRRVRGAAPPSQNRKKKKTIFLFFEKSVLKSRFLGTVNGSYESGSQRAGPWGSGKCPWSSLAYLLRVRKYENRRFSGRKTIVSAAETVASDSERVRKRTGTKKSVRATLSIQTLLTY